MEGIEQLEDRALIRGRELGDLLRPLEEAARLGGGLLGHGFEAEQLVSKHLQRPRQVGQERTGRLATLALVVGNDTLRRPNGLPQLCLGEATAMAARSPSQLASRRSIVLQAPAPHGYRRPRPAWLSSRSKREWQSRGLTQDEVGARVARSNRMIAYFGCEGAEPPGPQLPALALALRVSTDELLVVKALPEGPRPNTARLMKRLQQVAALPFDDQRAVLKVVDALLVSRGRTSVAG